MRVTKAYGAPNALCRKLEAGNGSVKGLKLLAPIDERALIAVEVIGIDFGGYARNGVAVLVKPVTGHGTLSVSAYELLDDTAAARKEYDAKSSASEYLRLHTPKDGASDKAWREAVMRERADMTDAQRKKFDSTAKTRFREKQEMVAGIREASSWSLKEIFKDAVRHRFDLGDSNVGDED